jgi:hypothetical protein
MLRITVELIPYGKQSLAKDIGELTITNISRDDCETATYSYILMEQRLEEDIQGILRGYKKSDKISWELVFAILNQIFNGGKNA